jgi:hypothetical protein
MGSIALSLRVALKQGHIGKKKAALDHNLKQVINSFMMSVALGHSCDELKTDPCKEMCQWSTM